MSLQTFSNVWYWFVVVVAWAMASHWLIGVPFDMLYAARKAQGQAIVDLQTIVDVQVRRITHIDDLVGPWAVALAMFFLSALFTMGFLYGLEPAKGAFVLLAPLAVIGWINLRLAHRLRRSPLAGADLVAHLFKVRLWSQIIGMMALFFTALYGMYFNIMQMNFF